MLQSRRALLYRANYFIRSNPLSHHNYVSCLSSTSHKNQVTPEELSQRYKTAEGSETDNKAAATTRSRGGSRHGAMNVGNGTARAAESGGDEWRRREDREMYEEQRETAAESAKAAAVGAMETGLKLGKMAKQTVDGMLDAAEKTTESVRDSFADDDDSGRRRGRARMSNDRIEERSSDKLVEDLRRRASGYDLDGRR